MIESPFELTVWPESNQVFVASGQEFISSDKINLPETGFAQYNKRTNVEHLPYQKKIEKC